MSAGCFHEKGLSFSRPGSALHTTLGAASPFPTPHSSTLGLVAESHFKQSMQQQLQEGNRHAAKQLKQLPPALAQHGQASIRRGGGVQGGHSPASLEGVAEWHQRTFRHVTFPSSNCPHMIYSFLKRSGCPSPQATASSPGAFKPTLKGGCRGAQPPSLQSWHSMYKLTFGGGVQGGTAP